MKKRLTLIASIILLAAMLFGCAAPASSNADTSDTATTPGTSGAATTSHSTTFNIVTSDTMTQVDPHNTTTPADFYCMALCYDSLIDTDRAGTYSPGLATSWEVSDDCTSITLELRQGVKFNNGEDFNADVVVYNVERLVSHKDDYNVPMVYCPLLSDAEKIDEYTVKINTSSADPSILGHLSTFLMVPMEATQELGDQMFIDMKQYGTGPWILDEWVSGQYAHFTKNPDYWDIANYDSYFEDGYVRFVSEPSSAAAAHVSGQVDAYVTFGGISTDILNLYDGSEDTITVYTKEINSYTDLRLGFPEDTPFYDEKVREALDLAIDRQTIADEIFGTGRVPNGVITEGAIGYDETMGPYEYDLERARELLAESSYDGHELEFYATASFGKADDVAPAITSMLEDVGFNIKLNMVDVATFNAATDWDIMYCLNLFSNGDPTTFISSRFVTDFMHATFSGTDADELIALCNAFLVETDPDVREDLAKQINNWNKDWHGPAFAIAGNNAYYALTNGIEGVGVGPDGFPVLGQIDWDTSAAE